MKLVRIGPKDVFHRYLTPKWAFLPISGAGAAADGGRFNRPGVEALYLSVSAQTALEEYRQGASITPPATLAAYTRFCRKILCWLSAPYHWAQLCCELCKDLKRRMVVVCGCCHVKFLWPERPGARRYSGETGRNFPCIESFEGNGPIATAC